jgi:hypothetical protein
LSVSAGRTVPGIADRTNIAFRAGTGGLPLVEMRENQA